MAKKLPEPSEPVKQLIETVHRSEEDHRARTRGWRRVAEHAAAAAARAEARERTLYGALEMALSAAVMDPGPQRDAALARAQTMGQVRPEGG